MNDHQIDYLKRELYKDTLSYINHGMFKSKHDALSYLNGVGATLDVLAKITHELTLEVRHEIGTLLFELLIDETNWVDSKLD